jgi:catechol 2,3-dioxygenase-like lactoylglutathione lyase family enzyme
MIPGLRGIEHVGLTVPDMDAAVRFFVDILGCEDCFRLGPFAADDDWMSRQVGVDARARIPEIRLLRCHHGANLELFRFEAPGQSHVMPRNSDLGGHHLAFYVDDMPTAIAYLRANDITVMGEPVVMTEGPSAGQSWVYFLSPWGLQLELVSTPHGIAFDQTGRSLWRPPANRDDVG